MPIKRKDTSAAIVTIRRANAMTTKGRRQMAAWLRKQAALLEQYGHDFSDRFTGRYHQQ